jgi:threonine dehydrogenase-like Zn-dependent dehydrogenase
VGPIGQYSARIARHLGVERVIGVDPVPERRAAAAPSGAETVDPNQTDGSAGLLIDMTGGREPDAIIDANGMEAHGHDEAAFTKAAATAQRATGLLPDRRPQKVTDAAAVDRLDALHVAVKAVRRGGTVSVSGVYGGEIDPMPLMEVFDRGVELWMGQARASSAGSMTSCPSSATAATRSASRLRHPPSVPGTSPGRLRHVPQQDRWLYQGGLAALNRHDDSTLPTAASGPGRSITRNSPCW